MKLKWQQKRDDGKIGNFTCENDEKKFESPFVTGTIRLDTSTTTHNR